MSHRSQRSDATRWRLLAHLLAVLSRLCRSCWFTCCEPPRLCTLSPEPSGRKFTLSSQPAVQKHLATWRSRSTEVLTFPPWRRQPTQSPRSMRNATRAAWMPGPSTKHAPSGSKRRSAHPLCHSLTVATVTVYTLTPAHKKSTCPPRPHTLASRLQGRGECSGYYMDYFKCIDKCAVKSLFKQLA